MSKIIFSVAVIVSTIAVMRPVPVTKTSMPLPDGVAAMQGPVLGGPDFGRTPPAGLPASFNVSYAGPDGVFGTTAYYVGNPLININTTPAQYDTSRHRWASVSVRWNPVGTIDCPGMLANGTLAPPYTGPLTVSAPVVIEMSGNWWTVEVDPIHGFRFTTGPAKRTGRTGSITGTMAFGAGLITIN